MDTENLAPESDPETEVIRLNKFINLFVFSMIVSFVCFILTTISSLSLLGSYPSGFERTLATSWLLGTLIIPTLMVIRLNNKDKAANVLKRGVGLTMIASVPAVMAAVLFTDALIRNLG